MKWEVVFTKDARKDAKKIASAGLRTKAEGLLGVLANNSKAATSDPSALDTQPLRSRL